MTRRPDRSLLRKISKRPARWLDRVLRRIDHVRLRSLADLGPGVTMARGSRVDCDLSIGERTRINGAATFKNKGTVSIGRYCAIGEELRVIGSNHTVGRANLQVALDRDLGLGDTADYSQAVVIGDASWIGDLVTVLPGASIGIGSIVASGSVVVKAHAIPPFHLAAGVPAKPIRARFPDEMIDFLLGIAWWDWPRDKVLRNVAFFAADLSTMSPAQADALIVD